MPFCRECGVEVQDSWKFCPHCNSVQENVGADSSIQNANVHLTDGVIGGDVHITQNNTDDISKALVQTLQQLGFSGESSPAELSPRQEIEVGKVLEVSEKLVDYGVEMDPWTEISLGNAAKISGRTDEAQDHYARALNSFKNQNQ